MDISVAQLRVSCVWAATVPELFAASAGGAGAGGAGYWVGDAARYQNTFGDLQSGSAETVRGATLPWKPRTRQRFWSYYAEALQAQQVTANRAWKLLIPFRMPGPIAGLDPPQDVKLFQEAYLFPHAVGFVLGLTADITGSLAAAVDRAVTICRDKSFTLANPAGKIEVAMAGIGEQAIRMLLDDQVGTGAAASLKPSEPFSVVSITGASGAALFEPVKDGDDLHQALEGFATLSQTWKVNVLQPFPQACVQQGKRRPQAHVLYAAKNGRTVWHPHYFGLVGAKRSPLNCYHRNLVFASLQTQSLLGLIGLVADERKQGNLPSGRFNDCVQRACGILGRMYGGDSATYRSHTIRRQIVDSSGFTAVGDERVLRGMTALT
jgi:hypothetical protein